MRHQSSSPISSLLHFKPAPETLAAFFIILLFALFILSQSFIGFSFLLWLAVSLVSVALILFFPRSGLYSFIFLNFIFEKFFTLQGVEINEQIYELFPPDIILGAITLGLLLRRFRFDSQPARLCFRKSDLLLIAFMAATTGYFLLSLTDINSDFHLAFSSFKYYAFYPLFYFATLLLINSRQSLLRLLKFGFAAAILIIFFIFFGLLAGEGLWAQITPLSTPGQRLLGARHAFFLSLAFLFYLPLLAHNNPKKSRLSPANSLLILTWSIGIIGSLMRNIWLGLFCALSSLYLISPTAVRSFFQKNVLNLLIYVLGAALLLVQISLFFPNSTPSTRLNNIFNSLYYRVGTVADSSGDESISWRQEVWQNSYQKYKNQPLTGFGLGKKIHAEFEETNYYTYVEITRLHNSFFVILFQMGPLVLLLLLAFILIILRKLYQQRDNWAGQGLIAVIILFMIVSLFQPYLDSNPTAVLFWIILGLHQICCPSSSPSTKPGS